MKAIHMTKEETAIYNGGDEEEMYHLLQKLRERAEEIFQATRPRQTVEIYTADGIVADVVQ